MRDQTRQLCTKATVALVTGTLALTSAVITALPAQATSSGTFTTSVSSPGFAARTARTPAPGAKCKTSQKNKTVATKRYGNLKCKKVGKKLVWKKVSAAPPAHGPVTHYLEGTELPFGGVEFVDIGAFSVNGVVYPRSFTFGNRGDQSAIHTLDFNLGRAYTTVQVTVGLRDDSGWGAQSVFQLLLDGAVVQSATLGLGQVQSWTVPTSGVLRLQLVTMGVNNKLGTAQATFASPTATCS